MQRIIQLIKQILGFNSPYSWTKWLRICFAVAALFIAFSFWSSFGGLISYGPFEAVLAVVLFVFICGPTVAVMLGISVLVGAVVGGILSGRKQVKSLNESKDTGDAELYALDKLRIKVQLVNPLFAALTIVWFIVSLFLYYCFSELFGISGVIIVCVVFFAGLVGMVAFRLTKASISKKYEDAFREQIVIKGLEGVLKNMDLRPGEKLDEGIIKASRLFGQYHSYSGNDYLSATYNSIRFMQSDVHLREIRVKQRGLKTRVGPGTVFKGRFMLFDYDAISNEPVFVLPRSDRPNNGDSILTELDSFNRKFCVVSGDAVSAFRILTPPVLEGIVLASDKLNCPFTLSFKDDKIYAAIFNGDSFEASAVGDVTLSELRSRVALEIQTVLDMVETLYLKKQEV